jgi:hypothetical protein
LLQSLKEINPPNHTKQKRKQPAFLVWVVDRPASQDDLNAPTHPLTESRAVNNHPFGFRTQTSISLKPSRTVVSTRRGSVIKPKLQTEA